MIAADRLLRITPLAGCAGLRIEGELDHSTLPTLRRELATVASGDHGFCVDLSGLAFIDGGCLRALVNAAAELHDGGRDRMLTLRSVPPHVRRLLELTGWQRTPGLHLLPPARPAWPTPDPRPAQLTHESTAPREVDAPSGVLAATGVARSSMSSDLHRGALAP
ncbi:STAS domain-containing protein [Streptosporangiaceae bacterium NEAU-GS5]|nr:STAS domain-containing protein [Streptosporangiaceae bacterium NEAU-GS5]